MKHPSPNQSEHQCGFTLIELLVVIATLTILAVLPLSALNKVKDETRNSICKSNLRQLTTGIFLYADENRNLMPWPPQHALQGRAWSGEQVFAPGGPGDLISPGTATADIVYQTNADAIAIHAEAGSVFPYVTGRKKVPFNLSATNRTAYPVYRCPSTGIKGEVLRVNYSMNGWYNPWSSRVSNPGVRTSAIVNPKEKVLLVQESPESMKETGFSPGTNVNAARVSHAIHDGKTNLTMSDGHLEEVTNDQLQTMHQLQANRYFDPLKYK